MIIDAKYINEYRPIANNIDPHRIEVYIRETESLDIAPVIGVTLYNQLSSLGAILIDDNEVLMTESNRAVYDMVEGELPNDIYMLLNGGDYIGKDGILIHFEGIRTAEAYLAYSRFIRNHSVNVTPFGVVQKSGDESTAVSQNTIAAVALDAERIGREYLERTMTFWKHIHEEARVPKRRTRFVPIGK